MAASEKVLRLVAALKENLVLRGALAGGAVAVAAVSGQGDDVFAFTVGGTTKAIVQITQWTATTPGGLDGIGLTQRVYAPHIAKVIFDADDTIADVHARVMYELAKIGVKVEVYAHATVSFANIAAANLKTVLDDVQYPLVSTI